MKIFIFLSLFVAAVASADTRTVFVQLFEWPWADVAEECEQYLGPNGFAAVQVSPPQEHAVYPNSPWWERYQPVSYRLESNGGTEREFRDMVARCHNAGVDVYADAVINHMSAMETGVGSGGTQFQKYAYPSLYSYDDFHHCGRNGNDRIVNYRDPYELRNCELLGLPDLDTGSARVQNVLAEYLNHLLDLGVAGFRLDAVKHMTPEDVRGILRRVHGAPYIVQEIIPGNGEPGYGDYRGIGDVNVFDYAFNLAGAVRDGRLGDFFNALPYMPASTDAVVFLENHDLQRLDHAKYRLLSQRDNRDLYFLAETFLLTWPYGYPQLFSGFDFSDYDQGPPSGRVLDSNHRCRAGWTCEHRVPGIASLVKFRNATNARFYASNIWTDGRSKIAFSRGDLGFVAINFGAGPFTERVTTSLPPGVYCNILSDCRESVWVDGTGNLRLNLAARSALVLQAPNVPALSQKRGDRKH